MPDMSTYVVSDGCAAKCIDDHTSALENISEKSVNIIECSEAELILKECAIRTKRQIHDSNHGSDTWLLIEKIFSHAGVGKNEKISTDVLQSMISSIPSNRTSIFMALTDGINENDSEYESRESLHKILFERKP